jgi:hypothetical protein
MGTAVTAGANNADGTQVALITALTHDVEFLAIGYSAFGATGVNGSTLLDILVDPAGGTAWAAAALIDDLLVGESIATSRAAGGPQWYYFPVWLKAGHSIGAHARTARAATTTGQIVVVSYGGNANPSSWWCGQHVTSIGITAASSKGTDHTAGNSGAFSSWTDFGSPLPAPCGALQFAVHGTNTDTTQNNSDYHFEFGVGGTRIGPKIYRGSTTSEASWTMPTGPIFCALPSGAQLQVRGTCAGTAEILDVAAYAVH